jgi:hypothetical protein
MALEPCNDDVYKYGESLGFHDMSKEKAEEYCKQQTEATGRLHDWHYVGGRVHIKALLASPASGDSAYDAAVIKGYKGTLEEWKVALGAGASKVLPDSNTEAS